MKSLLVEGSAFRAQVSVCVRPRFGDPLRSTELRLASGRTLLHPAASDEAASNEEKASHRFDFSQFRSPTYAFVPNRHADLRSRSYVDSRNRHGSVEARLVVPEREIGDGRRKAEFRRSALAAARSERLGFTIGRAGGPLDPCRDLREVTRSSRRRAASEGREVPGSHGGSRRSPSAPGRKCRSPSADCRARSGRGSPRRR